MIEIFKKESGEKISNAEYMNYLMSNIKSKDRKPLSQIFRMVKDGNEIDIDKIGF